MSTRRKPRVALGPIEIAGYYTNLAAGFEQLGVDCALLMLAPHSFRYADKPPQSRFARFALARAQATYPGTRAGLGKLRVLPENLFWRALLIGHAIRSYDMFVFNSGDALVDWVDLPLLKAFGKRVVFVFHGSDSRPPYLNGKHVRRAGADPGELLARQTRQTKRRLAWIERHADAMVDNPLSGHLHDQPFVNWFHIGIPFSCPQSARPPAATVPGAPLRVVHAPSDPESKGTPIIERAIEQARARGIAIDFIQLKGRPNSEVLDELARCDFVIDELYSDVPGAGLAFEAASFGRPSIVAGYGARDFERWIPPDMVLPTHYCHPDELDAAIDKLAKDAGYRTALGARAQRFVQEKCAPAAVAGRMLELLEGREAKSWHVDPTAITYLAGTGLTENTARSAVRAVLEAAAEGGLALAGKHDLVRRLKAFAYSEPLAP